MSPVWKDYWTSSNRNHHQDNMQAVMISENPDINSMEYSTPKT